MFGSQALETGLGLLFFFLIFSLVVTALTDIVAASLRLKARNLRRGLDALLNPPPNDGQEAHQGDSGKSGPKSENTLNLENVLARGGQGNLLTLRNKKHEKFGLRLKHLFSALSPQSAKKQGNFHPPQAVDADTFVVNLLEQLFERVDKSEDALESLKTALDTAKRRSTVLLGHADDIVGALPVSPLKADLERYISRALEAVEEIDGKRIDLTKRAAAVRGALHDWFDSQTAEIGDWYRQHIKRWTFAIGLIGAIAINANPVQVGEQLWAEPLVTAQLNTQLIDRLDQFDPRASATAPTDSVNGNEGEATADQDALVAEIERLRTEIETRQRDLTAFPIGWTDQRWDNHFCEPSIGTWLSSIVGWLIAAFAATLGAPFWFDLLKKVIALRSRVSQRNEAASEARARGRSG